MVIRWMHILLSIPIIGYIYGPVAQLHYAANAVRWVFFPIIVLSGFWLWKGHWFKKVLKRKAKKQSLLASNQPSRFTF